LEYNSDDDAFFENEQSSFTFDTFDEPNIERDALFTKPASYVNQDDHLETMQLIINNTGEFNNLEDNIPDLAINVEYSSWDDVGKALLKYDYNNGFVWVKKRTWPINGRMAGISFYCDKSGINIPKKLANPTKNRNKKSKKCGCEVHAARIKGYESNVKIVKKSLVIIHVVVLILVVIVMILLIKFTNVHVNYNYYFIYLLNYVTLI
jgi:hypothetical protein